jgi:4-hydroxy-3-methylbut-2-enyl diphosphate reductase
MKVIRAQEMGMCFGVRDALKITAAIDDPTQVTIHGELVHNAEVQNKLAQQGYHQSAENDRGAIPATPLVLITAHGISDAERTRLQSAGKQLIDTTCPLVRRAHDAAVKLENEGRHVLVIGKPGHVEVRGLVEDLASYDVISSADDVRTYEQCMLGIVSQTTIPPDVAKEICTHIQLYNPLADIRMVDTICEPTKVRQLAMLDLVTRVDAVVVVGGHNSNNTKQLVRICHEHITPVLHVERARQLDPNWFTDVATVGLTAGTSTLDSTIDEVHQALLSMRTGGCWYHGMPRQNNALVEWG